MAVSVVSLLRKGRDRGRNHPGQRRKITEQAWEHIEPRWSRSYRKMAAEERLPDAPQASRVPPCRQRLQLPELSMIAEHSVNERSKIPREARYV